jgi:lauroyl/myristoyl acyltransferase
MTASEDNTIRLHRLHVVKRGEGNRVSDDSTIRLHRLHVVKRGEENYYVVRWGGKSMIATKRVGIDALKLLDGRTPRRAQTQLQAELGTNGASLDLRRLVNVLGGANMIRSVDGKPASVPEVTLTTVVRFWYRYYLTPFLIKIIRKAAPINLIGRAIFLLNYSGNRRRISKQLSLAYANIQAVFDDLPASEVKAIQKGHYRYVTGKKVEPDLLMDHRAEAIDRWLERNFRCSGLENLRRVLDESRGAVVGVLHMERFIFTPLLLMKNGFNVCAVGTTPVGANDRERLAWSQSFSRLPGYGKYELMSNFNLSSVRSAAKLMAQGYVVFGCPDARMPAHQEAGTAERMRFFGMNYSALSPGTFTTGLRHHQVDAGTWFCWLAITMGTPFVVGAMTPSGRGSHLMFQEPWIIPRQGSARARIDLLAARLYAFWEQQVLQWPSSWYGWHSLHNWKLRSAEPPEIAALPGLQSGSG